jgi:5-methylcytosine-specific restriction endonuclease McrA
MGSIVQQERKDQGNTKKYFDLLTLASVFIMADHFITVDEEQVKREKARARELRNSQWWKRKRSSGTCYYCGGKFRADDLTMDHLIPIIRGGKSVAGNVVPACKECNTKKKYLLPTEWEEYLASLKKEE